MIYEFGGKVPKIGKGSYVNDSAEIIGNVSIGEDCFVAPGAKLRGDYGAIKIGSKTSVQDNCILHARPESECTVGNYVTLGHGCILHTCRIKDYAVIGMGAIISDFAIVGEWCAVGEGAVVKSNQEIPDGKIAVGIPAKIIGDVTEEYRQLWLKLKNEYVELTKRYNLELKKIKSSEINYGKTALETK
ncbi:MAG: gamma carbonic anhydrase family protein [Candidatus Thermoplasmatota archaeon]|nr:gamma carbonic anhydrase family protein [Candidatus Thermoplasmatota archaeon]